MKRYQELILCLTFLVVTFTCLGQNKKTNFGASASLDLHSYIFVNNYGVFKDFVRYKGIPGYSLGFIARTKISRKILFKYGFLYSSKKFVEVSDFNKFRAIHPDDPFLISSTPKDQKIRYASNFLDIPLDLQLHPINEKKVTVYPLMGLNHSFRVRYSTREENVLQKPNDITYNKYLLSAKVGLGVQVKKEKYALLIEPQVRFYLTEVHEQWLTENPVFAGLEVAILKL